MEQPSIGFVGGGRAARIILLGLDRAGRRPARVVVSEPAPDARELLARLVAGIEVTSESEAAAECEVVVLAVHPPVIRQIAGQLAPRLRLDATIISLAPKLTLAQLAALLGGFARIARVIPNAPSIVGAGFNPMCFATGAEQSVRRVVLDVFSPLGECAEVSETDLEAYAILTAMGPTYLWFQLYELLELATSFGLAPGDAQLGLRSMVTGALATMETSGLTPTEVMDLVAAKPLADGESAITGLYRSKLPELLARIRP